MVWWSRYPYTQGHAASCLPRDTRIGGNERLSGPKSRHATTAGGRMQYGGPGVRSSGESGRGGTRGRARTSGRTQTHDGKRESGVGGRLSDTNVHRCAV